MPVGLGPALKGLILPTCPNIEPPLSVTETWKANLLAIYTKDEFESRDEEHSWQYIAGQLQADIRASHVLLPTPWIRDLEHGLPKLDLSLNSAVANTWAAQVLRYLDIISTKAAQEDMCHLVYIQEALEPLDNLKRDKLCITTGYWTSRVVMAAVEILQTSRVQSAPPISASAGTWLTTLDLHQNQLGDFYYQPTIQHFDQLFRAPLTDPEHENARKLAAHVRQHYNEVGRYSFVRRDMNAELAHMSVDIAAHSENRHRATASFKSWNQYLDSALKILRVNHSPSFSLDWAFDVLIFLRHRYGIFRRAERRLHQTGTINEEWPAQVVVEALWILQNEDKIYGETHPDMIYKEMHHQLEHGQASANSLAHLGYRQRVIYGAHALTRQ